MVLQIRCTGTSYEIGRQHGSQASGQIKGSLAFYKRFFAKQTKKSWDEVLQDAASFLPYLQSVWPGYVEEIKGVADGAGVEFESILALNARTEIAFGLVDDGCTALSWKSSDASFIAQNWDWRPDQIPNIVSLHIEQPGKPRIAMMTEAGIIGKIGLNSAGVGVTLNAIKAKGANVDKLPVHLALRAVLDSWSQNAARTTLLNTGVSAACHITLADTQSGGVGLECSAADIVEIEMKDGMCSHTNHLIKSHPVEDLILVKDTFARLERVQELLASTHEVPTLDTIKTILKDEQNSPPAICRTSSGSGESETLFSIVMDLEKKHADVKMGVPTRDGEELQLVP